MWFEILYNISNFERYNIATKLTTQMKEMKCTATSAVNKPIRKERNKNILLLYIQTKFLTKDQEMHNIMMNIYLPQSSINLSLYSCWSYQGWKLKVQMNGSCSVGTFWGVPI